MELNVAYADSEISFRYASCDVDRVPRLVTHMYAVVGLTVNAADFAIDSVAYKLAFLFVGVMSV